ncbi:MAG: DUF6345 domain-containing protein [Candidatus Lernaella stagnicola]|nr:DUF6345 domain-containing protein [Candidatus Lernaella stagnicola]
MSKRFLLVALVVVGLVFVSAALADNDVMLFLVSYAVDECSLANTADHTYTFQGYMDAMEDANWDVTDFNDSSYHVKRTMSDCVLKSYGRDDANLEPFDIGIIEGHGITRTQSGTTSFRFSGNRFRDDDCFVWPRYDMHLGGTRCGVTSDLEFLHMHSCHSMTTGDDSHKNTWRPVFNGVHLITGYHGEADLNMHSEYEAFAEDAQSDSVAYEWIALWAENVFRVKVAEGIYILYDRCPVAYTAGEYQSYMLSRLQYETYGNRASWTDVEDPTLYKRLYISGCHGKGAGVIDD